MTSYALRPPLLYEIVAGNTFKPRVTVRYDSGTLVDLSGTTIEIALGNKIGTKVTATLDRAGEATGLVVGLFAANAVSVGDWELQTKITMAGETQTVSRDILRVLTSI